MGNQMLENLKAFLETDEGKESIERWGEKLRRAEERKDRWAEKFKQRCESDIDGSIEKILAKYDSKEYRDKEYGKGREPREDLLWVALEYAEKYCEECTDEKYLNMFTGSAYYIGSYVIQVMHGQGSVIRIDKIKN
jgi:hypothetical protein